MTDALFRATDSGGYLVTFVESEMEFRLERLHWERNELHGLLSVSCGLTGAKTIDGVVTVGTFQVTRVDVRRARARDIAERVRARGIDVVAMLEEVCQRVMAAENRGTPAVHLRDVVPVIDDEYNIHGFRVPACHPTILFGDGDSLKSLFALYVLGLLAQRGRRVALFDWELDQDTHHRRLRELFPGDMPDVLYLHCDRPLLFEVDRLRRFVRAEHVEFAVYDSVGFACQGPPENAEHALSYLRASRQVGIGGIHIAHVRRQEDDAADVRPFGSVYWHNGCRCSWHVRRADDTTAANIGLYHKKRNLTKQYPAVAFAVSFEDTRTDVVPTTITDVAELATSLPLWERIKKAVAERPLTLKELADVLHAKTDSIDKAVRRRDGMFTKVSTFPDGIDRVALLERRAAS